MTITCTYWEWSSYGPHFKTSEDFTSCPNRAEDLHETPMTPGTNMWRGRLPTDLAILTVIHCLWGSWPIRQPHIRKQMAWCFCYGLTSQEPRQPQTSFAGSARNKCGIEKAALRSKDYMGSFNMITISTDWTMHDHHMQSSGVIVIWVPCNTSEDLTSRQHKEEDLRATPMTSGTDMWRGRLPTMQLDLAILTLIHCLWG